MSSPSSSASAAVDSNSNDNNIFQTANSGANSPPPSSSSSSSSKVNKTSTTTAKAKSTNNSLGLDPKVYNFIKFVLFNLCAPIFGCIYLYKQLVKLGALDFLRQKGWFNGNLFEVVGIVVVLATLYKIWAWVYHGFLKRARRPESYGKWAIVTGTTAGIGEAFVHDLARRKMSILIISRSLDKLEAQKRDLVSKYGLSDGQIKFLVFDFKESDAGKKAKFYHDLDQVCKTMSADGGIGMLINNVGVANPNNDIPMYLEEFTSSEVDDLVQCNVFSVVNMTHTVLKYMKERKSGCVVNISSGSGNFPGPLLAVYSATKAFMTQFSNSMHIECWGSGVEFLVVTPFYIVTNLVKRKGGTFLIPMPDVLVKGTFGLLGRGKYVWQGYGYWFHGLLGFIADNYWGLYARNRRMMTDNRARADERAGGNAVKKSN